jgi:hypothetical protein
MDVQEMSEEVYLCWFAENLQLVSRFFDGYALFSLDFEDEKWRAGYSYSEDYEGNYFMDVLKGVGETALAALGKSYNRTLPVIIRLHNISLNFDNPKEFIKGEKYTLITLERSGEIQTMSITKMKSSDRGRREIFQGELGHILLYRPDQYRLIFPFIQTEALEEL